MQSQGISAVYMDDQYVVGDVMGLLGLIEQDLDVALVDYCAVEYGIWFMVDGVA